MSKGNRMGFPSREEVERLRSIYPPGRIVMLVEMHDEPQAPPEGTVGEGRQILPAEAPTRRQWKIIPNVRCVYTEFIR